MSAYRDEEDYDDYDPDDFYDDLHYEPDEADYAYEEWRAGYEEHCEQAHGGDDCDCRAPLGERVRCTRVPLGTRPREGRAAPQALFR